MERVSPYAVVISGMLALAASSPVSSAAQDVRTNKEMEDFVAKASTPAEHTTLVVLAAESIAAQTVKAPDLSDKELIALIQNAKTPADHEKLAAYYDQTAADLAATATRHKELAVIYRRMPPAKHCNNIATSATKGAEEARAIAEHHRMLAKEAAKIR